jgi:glycogen debranching enzyme
VFEAASHFSMRLPELYCGFPRVEGEGPTPYPVACLPQAWASGSVFLMLQAALGLHLDGERGEIQIERPMLPAGIESLSLQSLPLGKASINLNFQRVGDRVVAVQGKGDAGGVRVFARL